MPSYGQSIAGCLGSIGRRLHGVEDRRCYGLHKAHGKCAGHRTKGRAAGKEQGKRLNQRQGNGQGNGQATDRSRRALQSFQSAKWPCICRQVALLVVIDRVTGCHAVSSAIPPSQQGSWWAASGLGGV